MRYRFLIDKGIREYIKRYGDGGVSVFIYYALKHYLDYLEHADVKTLLEEIVKANKISFRKGGSMTMKCNITRKQFERLTAWGRYAKTSKIMNRALQFYIERVYNTWLDLEAIKYRHAKRLTVEVQEENLDKIDKLKYNGELEKAIRNYIEYFESLDAIGKLCEIAKINTVTNTGKKKKIEIFNIDTSNLKQLCEKYGLKIRNALIRVVNWYMGR